MPCGVRGQTAVPRQRANGLRVLHLTPEFPPVVWGGLGTAVGGLATASARAGLAVGVLLVGGVLAIGAAGYGTESTTPSRIYRSAVGGGIDSDGITFFQVAPSEAIERGRQIVRTWRPDVIHLHSAWLGPVARILREGAHLPIVFTVHSLDRAEYEIGGFDNHWEPQEAVIRNADRVIVLSRSEHALLERYCPDVLRRARIVGNGIDDSPWAQWAVAGRRGDAVPVALYSGRFVDRKGIRELLAAIPVVLERVPQARFVLMGGYGLADEIEGRWLSPDLRAYRQRISFTGWLGPNGVAQHYAIADILVVPSWYEPFGMVVLEGMLHGMAVAASAVGGPAEILEHERTGLLFPSGDPRALADTLLRLISDRAFCRRLGQAAASEVRRTWLWPRIVEKMLAVYEEAIEV
jgi:glycogen(starch) synthase